MPYPKIRKKLSSTTKAHPPSKAPKKLLSTSLANSKASWIKTKTESNKSMIRLLLKNFKKERTP